MVKGFYAQYKLAECCGDDNIYRPCFNYLLVEGRYIYASDGRVAVRASIDTVSNLTEEEMRLLDGKLIPRDTFKHLQREVEIKVASDGIVAIGKGYKTMYTLKDKTEVKYPNLQKIINESAGKTCTINGIGLSADKLRRVSMAMDASTSGVVLDFTGVNSVIIVRKNGSKEDIIGLVVPMLTQ